MASVNQFQEKQRMQSNGSDLATLPEKFQALSALSSPPKSIWSNVRCMPSQMIRYLICKQDVANNQNRELGSFKDLEPRIMSSNTFNSMQHTHSIWQKYFSMTKAGSKY